MVLQEALGSWLMSTVITVLTKNPEKKMSRWMGGKVELTLTLWKAAGFLAVQTLGPTGAKPAEV